MVKEVVGVHWVELNRAGSRLNEAGQQHRAEDEEYPHMTSFPGITPTLTNLLPFSKGWNPLSALDIPQVVAFIGKGDVVLCC